MRLRMWLRLLRMRLLQEETRRRWSEEGEEISRQGRIRSEEVRQGTLDPCENPRCDEKCAHPALDRYILIVFK